MDNFDISFSDNDNAVVSFDNGDVYDVHFYNDSDFSATKRELGFSPIFKPLLFLILIIGMATMLYEVVVNAPTFIFPALLGAFIGLSPITKMLFGFGFLDFLVLVLGKGNLIFSFALSLWWCLYFMGITNELWQIILGVPCMYGIYYYPFYSFVVSKDYNSKFFSIMTPILTILGGFVCFFLAIIFIPNFQDIFIMSPIILPTAMGLLVNFLSLTYYLFDKYRFGLDLVNYILAFVGIIVLFFNKYSSVLLCLGILSLCCVILLLPLFKYFFTQTKNIMALKKLKAQNENLKHKKIKFKKNSFNVLPEEIAKHSNFSFLIFVCVWWLFVVLFNLNGLVMYITGTMMFWYVISYIYNVVKDFSKNSYYKKNIIKLIIQNIFIAVLITLAFVFLTSLVSPFTNYVAVFIPSIICVINVLSKLIIKL